jgi:hypothetical protein
MNNNNNINYGGKKGTPTSYVKNFQDNLIYPLKTPYLQMFVKAAPPQESTGNYIKNFNNFNTSNNSTK